MPDSNTSTESPDGEYVLVGQYLPPSCNPHLGAAFEAHGLRVGETVRPIAGHLNGEGRQSLGLTGPEHRVDS